MTGVCLLFPPSHGARGAAGCGAHSGCWVVFRDGRGHWMTLWDFPLVPYPTSSVVAVRSGDSAGACDPASPFNDPRSECITRGGRVASIV